MRLIFFNILKLLLIKIKVCFHPQNNILLLQEEIEEHLEFQIILGIIDQTPIQDKKYHLVLAREIILEIIGKENLQLFIIT